MANTQSRFAAMPPRQKAIIAVVIIVLGVIVWQVIGMFRGGGTSPAPAPSTMTAQAPSAPPPGIPKPPTVAGGPPAPPPPVVKPGQPVPETTLQLTPLLKQQELAQTQYVSALNQLQLLKIQREIAETNQAIITSKLATVTAEKNISNLLMPEEVSTYTKKLTTQIPPAPPPVSTPPPPPSSGIASYSVISVTMELNQWHAVIGNAGKLYSVSIGDVLPTDGSTVTSIDQNGVTLEKNDIQRKIPLVAEAQ